MTTHKELIERLKALLSGATARPWVAFDEGRTLAIMKGKCPPLKDNGYPVRRWPEIITWGGFDGSDVPWKYRRANLHLIVALVNAAPKLFDAIEQRDQAISTLTDEVAELRAALDSMLGFTMNVRIGLQAGGAKTRAVKSLGDMIEYVRATLKGEGDKP